jgi:hypothetical protein
LYLALQLVEFVALWTRLPSKPYKRKSNDPAAWVLAAAVSRFKAGFIALVQLLKWLQQP